VFADNEKLKNTRFFSSRQSDCSILKSAGKGQAALAVASFASGSKSKNTQH